jgi:hypothetical protein
MNIIYNTTVNVCQAASARVTSAGRSVRDAAVNKVTSTVENAKQSLTESALGAVKYTTGLSNFAKIPTCFTKPFFTNEEDNTAYSPWLHERVAKAIGETTIGSAKLATNILYPVGAVCTALEATGLINAPEAFTVGATGKVVFSAVNTAAAGAYQAASAMTNNVVVPFVQTVVVPFTTNVALPLIQTVGEAVYSAVSNNLVDTVLGASTLYLVRKAGQDFSEAFTGPEVKVKIKHNRAVYTEENPKTLSDRCNYFAKGALEVAGAALLLKGMEFNHTYNR